jgi:hypothetical protein
MPCGWGVDKSGNNFFTEASMNLADDAQLVEMMIQAGFYKVFIGIETAGVGEPRGVRQGAEPWA